MNAKIIGILSLFICILLVLPNAAPVAAFAEQRSVTLDNHASASEQATTVTNIRIDGVNKPQAGKELDPTAAVTTAEGAAWEIGALWVRDDLSFATTAQEGHTYLPVLAFFVPQEYSLEGDAVSVTLSDSLTELFGTDEIISVYDARYGITYILPASLKDLFAGNENTRTEQTQGADASTGLASDVPAAAAKPSLVDIYCAQTARNKFTDEDLAWLIDLVINYLEPQAVELLLQKFPAFLEASVNGEIGTRIGLYIYYEKGDADGVPEHENATPTLAYVQGGVKRLDGAPKFCYMIGIDLSELVVKDAKGKPVVNPSTGKYTIVRSGEDFETFQNTIVHELFHAFMDDYNRAGMTGALSPSDMESISATNTDDLEALANLGRLATMRYPIWFIEGTASSMENVYAFRYNYFKALRTKDGSLLDVVDNATLTANYANGRLSNDKPAFFPLVYADGAIVQLANETIEVNTTCSRYVSGYLATLYLSDLAYQRISAGDSARSVNADGQVVFSADKIRSGLNNILYQMHNGQTLDQIIRDISANANGVSAYTSADDFTTKFVLGSPVTVNGVRSYMGDPQSTAFVTDFINYMTAVEKTLPNGSKPNGSILFDFNKDFASPLDPTKKSSSQYYQIVDSNSLVESSVSSNKTNIGGGKSSADEDNLDLIKSLDDMMAAAAKAPETETAAAPAAAAAAALAASPEDTPASTATQPAAASAEPVPAAQESAPTPAPASPAPEPPATPAQAEQEPQAESSTPQPATTN